jgi:ribosomal protein S18 acetylase RimI-like enzyme
MLKLIRSPDVHVNDFADVIYDHFKEIRHQPNVLHSIPSVRELLSSNQMMGYVIYANNSIIGYLIGERRVMEDKRDVYFLAYIYVIPKCRQQHIGTKMLQALITECKKQQINHIMLMCDTGNAMLSKFYGKFGFAPDPILFEGRKHDVLCKNLN